jgi:hypothetical protein
MTFVLYTIDLPLLFGRAFYRSIRTKNATITFFWIDICFAGWTGVFDETYLYRQQLVMRVAASRAGNVRTIGPGVSNTGAGIAGRGFMFFFPFGNRYHFYVLLLRRAAACD